MTPVEKTYLAMVIIALCVFAITLVYASTFAGGNSDKRASTPEEKSTRDSGGQPDYRKAA